MVRKLRQLGSIVALSLLVAYPIFALEDKSLPRTVTVQGQGKIQAVPDIATLSIEVTLEGEALDTISTQVRVRMQKALDTLKAQGINEKDIQTLAYQVQPRFEYDKAGNAKRKGYSVTNRVSVKVRDLKKVGKVLSAVVDSGVTTVNGPDFEFDNPQGLERQALAKAVDDAKAKATILAQAANANVGEVLTITEGASGNSSPPRPRMMRALAIPMAAQAEEPIEAGKQSFTADITATFSLR